MPTLRKPLSDRGQRRPLDGATVFGLSIMLDLAPGLPGRSEDGGVMIAHPLTRRSFLSIAASGLVLGAAALTVTSSPSPEGEGPEQDLADWRAFLARQRLWYGPEYTAWTAATFIEIAEAQYAVGTFDTAAGLHEFERRLAAMPFSFHDRAHAHLVGAIETHGPPDWLRGRVLRAWPPAQWPPEEWAQ